MVVGCGVRADSFGPLNFSGRNAGRSEPSLGLGR